MKARREITVCNGKAQGFRILRTDSRRQDRGDKLPFIKQQAGQPQSSDTNLRIPRKFLLNS